MRKGCNLVLESLENTTKILSAKDIYKLLKSRYQDKAPGLTTIYRAIETLREKDMVHTVFFPSGEKRYKKINPGEHVHQLVCEKCMKAEPIYNCNLEERLKDFAKQKQFLIDSHILEFFGYCKSCLKN